jgi:aconitate hydratase
MCQILTIAANPATHSFVTSPDLVVAMSLAGTLNFNPLTDTLKDKDGNEFMLKEPTGAGLPSNGYDPGMDTYQAPPAERSSVNVAVSPTSDRLQLLEPFNAWDGKDALAGYPDFTTSEELQLTSITGPPYPDQGSGQDHH